jgi:Ser/Thr protein kinase RdoA (MazF antagonist)
MLIPRAPDVLTLEIDRCWNGAPCADPRLHGAVSLSSTPEGLRVTAVLPHQASPRIPTEAPGTRVPNLWEYDVVECFIAGPKKYLEVELGAGGHFLVLGFSTRAPRIRDREYERFRPAVDWQPSAPEDPRRWRSSIVIPWEMVPARAGRVNAFVIAGGRFLAYHPLGGGSAPDFHQPARFPKATLQTLDRPEVRPRDILGRFPIAAPRRVARFGTGLINRTYRLRAHEGEFVLQKVHGAISAEALDDMRIVTEHLAARGMRVPALLPTKDGQIAARDPAGGRWRLYPLIPGRIFDAVVSPDMAREAGRIVGEMHRHLRGLALEPKGAIEHFHDTRHVLEKLRAVASYLPQGLRPMAEDLLQTASGIVLTRDAVPEGPQVVHGDLKISNILFDDRGRAIGFIDFDTIMRHFRAIDVGDALRSWCNRTAEDDPDATFDRGICEAALIGYGEGWGAALGRDEKRMFLRATLQITCELASRFLIDVVCDDYFGYRRPYTSRRAANIARAIGQHHLAKTIPSA